jgi:hypothetical protein
MVGKDDLPIKHKRKVRNITGQYIDQSERKALTISPLKGIALFRLHTGLRTLLMAFIDNGL